MKESNLLFPGMGKCFFMGWKPFAANIWRRKAGFP